MAFQASQGSFFFTYVGEIATDASIGWANFILFTWVLLLALFTQSLFDGLGPGYVFMLFAIFNFVGTFLMSLLLKDISGMSPSEKKAIFMSKSARI